MTSSIIKFILMGVSVSPRFSDRLTVIQTTMPQDLEEAIAVVRKSPVREEIIRELYIDSHLRPSEIFDRISDRIETTNQNFYQNLRALTGALLDKTEGSQRMTLYSLTETGETVAEELGLTKSEGEQLRSLAFESSLSAEEIVEILEEVQEEKEETGE